MLTIDEELAGAVKSVCVALKKKIYIYIYIFMPCIWALEFTKGFAIYYHIE